MAIERRGVPQVESSAALLATKWAGRHPSLMEFLLATTYADGSTRKAGTVTVFVEDGCVKLCVSDRDVGETAWVSADSVDAALDVAEKKLAGGSLEWRKPYTQTRGKGR